jgi:hypothetical protein
LVLIDLNASSSSYYEIKIIPHTPKKPVNKLPGKIKAVANSGDTFKATLLAQYGKELSPVESPVAAFYCSLDLEAAMKTKESVFPFKQRLTTKFRKKFAKIFSLQHAECRKTLSDLFLFAVENHKRDLIIELAEAVWFFRDKRALGFPTEDRIRTQLLLVKAGLEHLKVSASIRDIAALLGIEPTADGNSQLREMCKELGVPWHYVGKRELKKKKGVMLLRKLPPT